MGQPLLVKLHRPFKGKRKRVWRTSGSSMMPCASPGKHFAGGQAFAMRSMIELGIRARRFGFAREGSGAMPFPDGGGALLCCGLCVGAASRWSVGSAIPGGQRCSMAIAGVSAGLGGGGSVHGPSFRAGAVLLAGLASGWRPWPSMRPCRKGRVSRAAGKLVSAWSSSPCSCAWFGGLLPGRSGGAL